MEKYTTQMDAAGKGIVTPQMKNVLANEPISEQDLLEKVAKGYIAIPANKNHFCLKAAGVGEGLKTKINVNLGVSKDRCSFDSEMKVLSCRTYKYYRTFLEINFFQFIKFSNIRSVQTKFLYPINSVCR